MLATSYFQIQKLKRKLIKESEVLKYNNCPYEMWTITWSELVNEGEAGRHCLWVDLLDWRIDVECINLEVFLQIKIGGHIFTSRRVRLSRVSLSLSLSPVWFLSLSTICQDFIISAADIGQEPTVKMVRPFTSS